MNVCIENDKYDMISSFIMAFYCTMQGLRQSRQTIPPSPALRNSKKCTCIYAMENITYQQETFWFFFFQYFIEQSHLATQLVYYFLCSFDYEWRS
ncbi:hypothetical protein P5673_031913 [Acropora cervicornis]|uniref:Uncharacterized protein n=1 Tax=Acropora cervicornis TaxID=6130 RepID=A0AAD9USG0_ACRCE|nr:hypothetical protein P5673_031913 [Acropora cervicornis]